MISGSGSVGGAEPERVHPDLERLHLSMVVGTPDVDEVIETALELVGVIRQVVEEVGGCAVTLDEHPVALIAEVLASEPRRPVAFVRQAGDGEPFENGRDLSAIVEGAFGEPRVEVHADASEILLQLAHGVGEAPLAGLFVGDVVAELGAHPRGHVHEVLTLVAPLGELGATGAGLERRGERVELSSRVVQVVLAVHLGTLGREHVRDRVADGDPSTAAGVQRTGRVGRDELEVDPASCEGVAPSVGVAGRDDRLQDLVQPGRRQEEVDEPRSRDLDPFDVTQRRRFERIDDPLRDLTRWRGGSLADLERDIGLPVAVVALLRRLHLDPADRLGQSGRGERSLQGGDEIVDDHGGLDIGESPPNPHNDGASEPWSRSREGAQGSALTSRCHGSWVPSSRARPVSRRRMASIAHGPRAPAE